MLHDRPDTAIILSDINMPEMDGLKLLSKLDESNPLIKTVIVSAYGDMDNIPTAMNRGAFDFVTKPVNFDDLELTMEKTIKYVNQLKETLKAIKENNIHRMYVDASVLNFLGTRRIRNITHRQRECGGDGCLYRNLQFYRHQRKGISCH